MGTSSASMPGVRERRRRRVGVAVVTVTAMALWWAWPTLAGHDDGDPVVVVLEPSIASSAPVFEKAVRERGRRVRVLVAERGWCEAVSTAADGPATLRVVVADPEPGCDPWSTVTDGDWWWISPSGTSTDVDVPAPVRTLDLVWSLGDGGTLRRACEWWDVCEGDGQVAVRSEPGVLTPAGAERVARTVAVLR